MPEAKGIKTPAKFFSYNELAERWKLDRPTIIEVAKRGEIEKSRVGGAVRFALATIRAFEEKHGWTEGAKLSWSPFRCSVHLNVPSVGWVETHRDSQAVLDGVCSISKVEEAPGSVSRPSPQQHTGRGPNNARPPVLNNEIDLFDLEGAIWQFYLTHNWWPTVCDVVVEGLDQEKYGFVTWRMIDMYCKQEHRGLDYFPSLLSLSGALVQARLNELKIQGLVDPTLGKPRIRH